MADEVIISKIRKLIRLANGTSFEAEAETAIAHARALMDRHNIEEAEVLISEDEDEKQTASKKFYDDVTQDDVHGVGGGLQRYEMSLAHTPCKVCDVKSYLSWRLGTSKRGNRITRRQFVTFVGPKRDVAVAKALYIELLVGLRRNATQLYGPNWGKRHTSYAHGFCYSLYQKACEIVRKSQRDNQTTDIVLAKEVILDKWLEEQVGKLKEKKHFTVRVSPVEYRRGQIDGSQTSLDTNGIGV